MTQRSWLAPALGCLLAASMPGPARAADPSPALDSARQPALDSTKQAALDNARQVVGLFLQSCVEFTGDRNGLRDWAKKAGLPELRDNVADAFLYGLPGTVYDATSKGIKLVLVSEDNGSCSAIAQLADGPTVLKELERILLESRVRLNITGDKADPKEGKLLHREYTASGAKREWQMLVSTVNDPAGGEAMLTANPW